jgi:hypothetical protein
MAIILPRMASGMSLPNPLAMRCKSGNPAVIADGRSRQVPPKTFSAPAANAAALPNGQFAAPGSLPSRLPSVI